MLRKLIHESWLWLIAQFVKFNALKSDLLRVWKKGMQVKKKFREKQKDKHRIF